MEARKERKKAATVPYDMWLEQQNAEKRSGKSKKIHPSLKRTRKNNLPHPGQSYNPDPVDHERLLKKVAKKEMEYKKKATTIRKALEIKVDQRDLQEHEKEQLVSGIKHLIEPAAAATKDQDNDNDDSAYSDYDEKDFEAILKDKAVYEKRKTKKQRLGQLKDKLQRKAAKLRKLKNIRLSKIDGVKKLAKELDKKDKELALKGKKKHKMIKNERLAQKFEPSDPIYCLTSELPKNLRETTCPMDAIVREQLESFQSRLMVEPSRHQTRNSKYKKKQYERKCAEEHDG